MGNFDQIVTFIEVANTRSFAEASRRLALSTSTVSARVKALESRLNVRLLNRNTRTVSLTDESETYLTRCQQALEQLLDVEDSFTQKTQLSGQVKVTIPLNLPTQPFIEILSRFAEAHPQVSFDVHVTDEPLDLVLNNIDIAIRGGAPGALSLISRKLGEGTLKLFASGEYFEETLKRNSVRSLQGQIVFDPLNILASLPENPGHVSGGIKTQNFQLVKQLAIQAKGIALLPEGLCVQEVNSGQLVVIETQHTLPTLPLYVVFPSRQHLPTRVRSFIDFLVEAQNTFPLV